MKWKNSRDGHAMAPELKVNVNAIPEYRRHFTFDQDNPYQRKITPVRTLVELYKVTLTHQNYLQNCKLAQKGGKKSFSCNDLACISAISKSKNYKDMSKSIQNIYGKISTPILIIVGTLDPVVDNHTTRAIYDRILEGEGKSEQTVKYIEIKELEHGPNSNWLMFEQVVQLIEQWHLQFI